MNNATNSPIPTMELADLDDPKLHLPITDWYKALNWVKYWFEEERAFENRYAATYDFATGICKWYDDKQFGSDKELMEGSFQDMVNWITRTVQKHCPLVSMDVVEAYARIHYFEKMCYHNSSLTYEKKHGL